MLTGVESVAQYSLYDIGVVAIHECMSMYVYYKGLESFKMPHIIGVYMYSNRSHGLFPAP